MLRRKRLVLAAAAVAVAAAGAGVVLRAHGGTGQAVRTSAREPAEAPQLSAKKTYAQLVAANYRPLTPQRSTRLLRYANAAFACMSHDLELGRPQTSPTKITMTLPAGTKPLTVLRIMGRCGRKIGDPPPGSSFQLRGHAIIVYLPKYCILDEKTVARTTALPAP